MRYFSAVEVDQIQRIIFDSDKLKEMIGASRLIDNATCTIEDIIKKYPNISFLWSVSGVYKLGGNNLEALADALWEIREALVDKQGLPVTFELLEGEGKLVTTIFRELDAGIRQQKDSRYGEDGAPSCPYFVPCRILPDEYANHWHPDWDDSERQRRRALVSEKAWIRKDDDQHGLPFIGDVIPGNIKMPNDFDDLTVQGATDSYIAFIKGDGDGLGKLLSQMDWDSPRWINDKCSVLPAERPLKFSQAVRIIFIESVKEAIKSMLESMDVGGSFPIVPLLVSGEDLWILSRRDMALPLISQIGQLFEKKANDNQFLQLAFDASNLPSEKLTLSFGVLFAQKGHPFDHQTDLVNELLKNAKSYRKNKLTSDKKEGCIDFLWLDTAGREPVSRMRAKAYGYNDNNKVFRLYSHPWTLTELQECLDALSRFKPISRRKLYQWRSILRTGDGISTAHAYRWFSSLEKKQRDAWRNAVAALPSRLQPGKLTIDTVSDLYARFWQNTNGNEHVSAIQDLLELMEVMQNPEAMQQGGENESIEN